MTKVLRGKATCKVSHTRARQAAVERVAVVVRRVRGQCDSAAAESRNSRYDSIAFHISTPNVRVACTITCWRATRHSFESAAHGHPSVLDCYGWSV